ILQYYQWHQAIMIYSDDEFGHNGIDALTNILMAKSQQLPLQFSNKVALDPRATNEEITQLLRAMQSSETSVFVVHVASSNVLFLLDEAQRMGLMSEGYVWISTEGAISLLMGANMNSTYLSSLTGMVGTRVAIRDNPRLLEFKRRWKNLDTVKYPGSGTDTVSPYSLLAYDAFWVAARALHNLSHLPGASFPFRPRRPVLPPDGGGSTDFARLKVSKAGVRILEELVKTKMDGIIGKVAFDENHDRVGVSYEVVNLVASNFETLGYWEQGKGLVAAPSKEPSNTTLKPAVWPGNTSKFPRGWLPSKGKALRIAVPFGPSAVEQYVSRTPDGNFSGLCVEVFQRAMALLPYPVGYSLVAYDFRGSSYEDLIRRVANKEYDGAVGDITVTADRAQIVDFTQPFMESGLGLVVPVLQGDPANPWAFLYPFTGSMWALMIASIVFTAAVIWYLEHNQNLDFGGGPYHHQLTTSLWFSFASMVRSQEQHVGTVLGRFVVISWLFVVLIVTCSYTANLTSILTVNNLTPPVQSLAAVITSGSVVGYLNGSFSEKHLLGFGVRRKQLQPLNSVDEYAEAMLNGTVVGVVDERPFLDLILTQDCTFTTGDADISTLGWAFAFQKGSNLAVDLSKAIAQLSETGQLRSIHSNYVPNNLTCSGDASGQSSDSLGVEGFQNLFILYAAMATFACLMYLGVLLYRGHLAKKELEEEGEEVSGGMSAIKAKPWMNPFKHFIYLYNLGVAWSIARNIECDEDEPFYDADTFDVYEGTSFNQSDRDAAAGEILPARLLPSQIKNKQKRSAVTAKLRAEKEKGKKQRLKRRRQEEERAVALGEAAPPRKVARTIDSTREVDETIAQPDDDEVTITGEEFGLHADEAQDEFAPHFNRERPPKVLITTCQRIHPTMKQFIKELLVVIPGSEYYERRQYRIKEVRVMATARSTTPTPPSLPLAGSADSAIVQYASARDYTAMIVVNENRNKPSGLLIHTFCSGKRFDALMLIGLPEGPTALFKLSQVMHASTIPPPLSLPPPPPSLPPPPPDALMLIGLPEGPTALFKLSQVMHASTIPPPLSLPPPPPSLPPPPPDALMLIGLPEGPTALFKLSSLVLRKDIKNAGRATGHLPELILNNFSTRLGHRVGRLLASLFPQDPEFKGRRVVTLHNQRDFIFFRHHRYIFEDPESRDESLGLRKKKAREEKERAGLLKRKKAAEAAAAGKKTGSLGASLGIFTRLQECGPRFTLKLMSVQRGTFDSKGGEYEWVYKVSHFVMVGVQCGFLFASGGEFLSVSGCAG
ncbi:unnamed protein product, partial [Closterium sp. NIES-65]